MKYANHVTSGKIISAEDASHKDFYGIFLCPECKETLTLRKGYFRNGIEISPTFVHPSLDDRESCSQRITWDAIHNSFNGKPLSQGQLRSLLHKNILDAICSYYLCWSGYSSNFNHLGKLDEYEFNTTQARTKITKFFQTEGIFTKQDAESIGKTEKRFYEMQSDPRSSTGQLTGRQILELISVPRQFYQYMSVLYKQNNKYDEPSDCIEQQTTEPRLKELNKFIKSSKLILGLSNNIVFIQKNINKIKNESFSSSDKDNPLIKKHFDLVSEVSSFLFTSAKQDLVYKLAPYFITFPYQRRLKDTNSHWKKYEYSLEQVEEIFNGSKSKIGQFYYLFNRNDSSKYPEAFEYVSYLLLNVVNILVRIDWISWFSKWVS